MASARSALRRALLYVPSASRLIKKPPKMKVDCVAYDLEDSVWADQKVEARENVRHVLNGPRPELIGERAVRINSVESGLALDDLNEVLKGSVPDTLIVPKVESPTELEFVTDMMRHHQPLRHKSAPAADPESPPIQILALIESAKGISNLSSICKATPYLAGLIFGAEDFALDLSLTRTPPLTEFLYARSAIVTECRAHGLPSVIDMVYTGYRDFDQMVMLQEECIGGRNLGFNGKQCIHPSQVGFVQEAFMPTNAEIEWALKVSMETKGTSRGVFEMDGKMIDAPAIRKARAILDKVQARGLGSPYARRNLLQLNAKSPAFETPKPTTAVTSDEPPLLPRHPTADSFTGKGPSDVSLEERDLPYFHWVKEPRTK